VINAKNRHEQIRKHVISQVFCCFAALLFLQLEAFSTFNVKTNILYMIEFVQKLIRLKLSYRARFNQRYTPSY